MHRQGNVRHKMKNTQNTIWYFVSNENILKWNRRESNYSITCVFCVRRVLYVCFCGVECGADEARRENVFGEQLKPVEKAIFIIGFAFHFICSFSVFHIRSSLLNFYSCFLVVRVVNCERKKDPTYMWKSGNGGTK